jgi:hypothetical protein
MEMMKNKIKDPVEEAKAGGAIAWEGLMNIGEPSLG